LELLIEPETNGGLFVKKAFLAAALAATPAIAVPMTAPFAQNTPSPQTQTAPSPEEHGGPAPSMREGGPAPWMRGEGDRGMEGWRGMMMHRMEMHRNPQQWCIDRLARRAAMRAYVGAELGLTPEQQPLWDRLQTIAQTEQQKERQLCSSLRSGEEETMLDRLDRMQAFLSTRLEAIQAAKPAVQALYQALTPDQRAIFDHPFHR
jgi:LTXXQ motif family protein